MGVTHYDTAPLPFTRITLRIDELIHSDGDPLSPAVEINDEVKVEFRFSPAWTLVDEQTQREVADRPLARSRFLQANDKRVFFMQWAQFPVPKGIGPNVWRVDETFGTWGLDQSLRSTFPTSWDHIDSLITGRQKNEVAGEGVPGIPIRISLSELRRVAEAEAKTRDATVASYKQWPVEPGRRERQG